MLHDLRVTCKSLRYLIELYAPLYDEHALDDVITALKRLQDHLGILQDSDVQTTAIASFGAQMRGMPGADPCVQTAIAQLTKRLRRRARKTRSPFEACVGDFDSRKNRRRIAALFSATSPRSHG